MDCAVTSAISRAVIYAPKCYRNQLISRRVLQALFTPNATRASLPLLSWTSGTARPAGSRLRFVTSYSASSSFGNGGTGGGFSSGGGGGGEDGGGVVKGRAVAGGAEEVSNLSSDVIVLNVGGMTCGGCAASVKRILENQPQVSSASVNLTTETAIVWPVSEAKVVANWQKELGEALAKQLTSCGFKSNFRGENATEGDISA